MPLARPRPAPSAEVERSWFRRRFAEADVPKRYQTEADPDADFNGAVADPAVAEEAWAAVAGGDRIRRPVHARPRPRFRRPRLRG